MPAEQLGLRERKKARTRRTIREVAFRLFREQGYADTTIEQIAAEAEVSPSTFFRYFPTKEQLVLADDLDPPMLAAVAAQPDDVAPFAAFRLAAEQVFAELPESEVAFERERQELMAREPELRRAVMQQLLDSVGMIAGMIAERTGRSADDFEVRVHAGAMAGAMIGLMNSNGADPVSALHALAVLEDGLLLGRGLSTD